MMEQSLLPQHQQQQQLLLEQQQQQQQPIYLQHHQQQPENIQQFHPHHQQHVHLEPAGFVVNNQPEQMQSNQDESITKELGLLDQMCSETANELRICRHKGEELNLYIQQRNYFKTKLVPGREHELQQQLQQQQPDENPLITLEKMKRDKIVCEESIKLIMIEMNEFRDKIVGRQGDIIKQLSIIQNIIIFERLPAWHQNQQLASNGPTGQPSESSNSLVLDQLQNWIEMILSIMWRTRNVLKCLIQLMNNFFFEKYKHFYNQVNNLGLCLDKLLEGLILKSLIVEKQPPQVMKTNTRFASTVRFLGGDKLNLQMINPTVRVTILSEPNARAVIQRHQEMIKTSWEMLEYSNQQEASSTPPTRQQQQQQQQPETSPVHQQQAQFCNQPYQQQTVIQSNNQAQFFQQQQQQQFYPSTSPGMNQPQVYQQQPEAQPQPMETGGAAGAGGSLSQSCLKILNMSNFESSGEILNACNNLEYQESGQFVWQFRNMQLKKIKRTEKRGTESVMDEKFVLLFHAEFRIQENNEPNCWSKSGDLSFHLMAFSLPVVVIVHGNQEPHAVATVTWHNAFAQPDGVLYYVPDHVTWPQLGHVLSEKFRAYAGKGLSQENLNYLAAKISRDTTTNSFNRGSSLSLSTVALAQTNQDLTVSWNQFAKESLPDKNFSFWEWFYSILKLTREYLAKLWEADRIYGFICKNTCNQLLLTRSHHTFIDSAPCGTFILRFSETELGGITIAWVASANQQQQQQSMTTTSNKELIMIDNRSSGDVLMQEQDMSPGSFSQLQNSATGPKLMMHIQPFLAKDLNTRSLADRIRDLDNLVYLYPDVPKDEAFGEHYTPIFEQVLTAANGYVKPMLITTLVEKYARSSSSAASPAAMNSPNSFSQHSPTSEPIYQPKEQMNPGSSSFNQANFGGL